MTGNSLRTLDDLAFLRGKVLVNKSVARFVSDSSRLISGSGLSRGLRAKAERVAFRPEVVPDWTIAGSAAPGLSGEPWCAYALTAVAYLVYV